MYNEEDRLTQPVAQDQGAATDVLLLTPQQSEAIVRVVEASPHVQRRHQFFVWTQSQMQALLPHQLLVCAAYERQRRDLALEVFHSVVLPGELLALLTDRRGPLVRGLLSSWVEGNGRSQLIDPARWTAPADGDAAGLLRRSGIEGLLVHGVARPQRPAEIESLFVFASTARWMQPAMQAHLEVLLPHLHSVWQRVVAAEREMAPSAAPVRAAVRAGELRAVTGRERQILLWVREGKSNQQIAEGLGISPLTVKNHVQKILRKLGASNRAHAVAEAMSQGLLDGGSGSGSG